MHDLYYNVLILVALLSFVLIRPSYKYAQVIEVPQNTFNLLIIIFAILCMAYLPVPPEGGADRARYARDIMDASSPTATLPYMGRETLFYAYQFFSAKIMKYQGWFILTATIYVGNYYWAARRLSKDYAFVLLLMMLCYFQFYSYGTNTIRAGLASSFVLLGITFVQRPVVMIALLAIASCIHTSMLIPIAAIACAYYYRNSKVYLLIWIAAILFSYFVGTSFEAYVSDLAQDSRGSKYLMVDASQTRYKVGFRWDFLSYSALPVIVGYYYIFMHGFRSNIYALLYNTYLLANAFWVLVIRANYTDRFAFLSWFMMPVILVYPLVTKQLYRDITVQRRELLLLISIQASFFFLIYLLYGGNFLGFIHL